MTECEVAKRWFEARPRFTRAVPNALQEKSGRRVKNHSGLARTIDVIRDCGEYENAKADVFRLRGKIAVLSGHLLGCKHADAGLWLCAKAAADMQEFTVRRPSLFWHERDISYSPYSNQAGEVLSALLG